MTGVAVRLERPPSSADPVETRASGQESEQACWNLDDSLRPLVRSGRHVAAKQVRWELPDAFV